MKINEWHAKYRKRLMEQADISQGEANDILKAGLSQYDYNDSPEDAADEELSLWASDGEITSNDG